MTGKPVPIANDHPTEWHWDTFADWTAAKGSVGEPSPHMQLVAHLSRGQPWEERAWRAGCYAAPYSVLTGEILWTHWPWERVQAEPDGLHPWLKANFRQIHVRTERRCVRTPGNMARCLLAYVDWARWHLPEIAASAGRFPPDTYYDVVWASAEHIDFMGRYILIRLIELLRRSCDIPALLYDIRAIGGWSPVRMLTLLWPDHQKALLAGDGKLAIDLGFKTLDRLRTYPALADLTPYRLAAMLCEYRKAYENRDEYPARTLDQELASYRKLMPHWADRGFESRLMTGRQELFPRAALGEHNGWDGLRKDLGAVLRDHGYVWSDLRYDYRRSANLAAPAERESTI